LGAYPFIGGDLWGANSETGHKDGFFTFQGHYNREVDFEGQEVKDNNITT